MDGKHLINKEKYNLFIADWLNNSIKNKSWEKFQDLHLDEISDEFKLKNNWIDGSFFIYDIILNLIDIKFYNCLLVIPISYSDKKTNIDSLTWDKIKTSLDLTPPSFYIFPKGEKNYEETLNELEFIDELSELCSFEVFFKEQKESESEYNRCVYVIKRD